MADEVFQITTLTRVFADRLEIVEGLGLPEISAISQSEAQGRACLEAKSRLLLEDANLSPAIWLHRRRLVAAAQESSLDLVFVPTRRSPDWQEPVTVVVRYVHWEEDGLHHALVPGLEVHVFASRASLIPERLEAHVRLVLAGRGKQLTLRVLEELARVAGLRLGSLAVTVHRKTPRQLAAASEVDSGKKSILSQMASELPPFVSDAAENAQAKHADAPKESAAYELDDEVAGLAEALAGANRRSVLIVGPPGSGKSALVWELARRRQEFGFGHTPFWTTSGARLMSGPIGFGMWQDRCQKMCGEAAKTQAILHLNNLAELLEVGKASRGQQSVGSFLRPAIARGDILAIAECTPEQLGAIERKEPHLAAAFQQFILPERTPQQTLAILGRVLLAAPGKPPPDVQRNEAALVRLQRLHQRYATYSANPGRPLRFLNNLLADSFPEKQLDEIQVTAAFSRETGLPAVLLDDNLPLNLEQARDWFSQRVLGQAEAVDRVVDLLAVLKARIARPRKPLGSFLFIGPTGTGKTEMAKALAEFLFGDAGRLIRFDLNEFSDPVSVQRLVGGPAVGTGEGLLTARVREQPFSVVLLDEFEKADPAFFDLLLQVLGDGRLTDAQGRVADFCNSVIVMTSNLGAEGFQRGPAGFRAEGMPAGEAQTHFSEAVRQFLRPEIYNRLDAIVPYRTLTPDIVLGIARAHLAKVQQRDGLRLRSVRWEVDPAVAEYLAARGYSPRYGARPLKRAIERELLVPLAEALNRYAEATALQVDVGIERGNIRITMRADDDEAARERLQSSAELASRVVALRRLIGQLERCAAVRKIEDEIAMLESFERRLKDAARRAPQLQARLAKLPGLRASLAAVAGLATRGRQLEVDALGLLYRRETLTGDLLLPELSGLEAELRRRQREVFRHQQESPDDVVLAFYSEHRETLLQFAAAYCAVGETLGRVMAMDHFVQPPGARNKETKLLRQKTLKRDTFFATPPEKLIGIVLHLRGDLFAPRFKTEAGLHGTKDRKLDRVCLVETAGLPFDNYQPPNGIERQGGIAARRADWCRSYDRAKNLVQDAVCGERPWTSVEIGRCIVELTEQRLELAIELGTT